MSRIVRLSPPSWRHEPEFTERLTTRPPGPLDRIDVLRGAIDAHLDPQVRRGTDPTRGRPGSAWVRR